MKLKRSSWRHNILWEIVKCCVLIHESCLYNFYTFPVLSTSSVLLAFLIKINVLFQSPWFACCRLISLANAVNFFLLCVLKLGQFKCQGLI